MDALLFDGLVSTAYGQIYVASTPDGWLSELDEAFRGQRNGLCGAAVEGALFLVIGTHTGDVRVRVVVADSAPPVGEWEDVVEAAFTPATPDVPIEGWGGMFLCRLHLPVASYRVRWSCNGMDAAHRQGVAMPGQPSPERYELTFWPSAAAPDEIVRATSDHAAYWHREMSALDN